MNAAIEYSKKEGIAKILFNRPGSYNSVNAELTGKGKAFCAGQDLKEVTSPGLMPGFKYLLEKHYTPIVTKIVQLNKPVIAAVNGVAAGAGANIALACDIVVAIENAKFIQAFSAIGLIPDSGGTYILPRLIGRARAMAYTMLGDKIDAKTAAEIGMIYKCIPATEFETEVEKMALKFASMATKGLALTKRAINGSFDNTFNEQMNLEKELQIEASETDDYKEGVTAFLEKRKANFKG